MVLVNRYVYVSHMENILKGSTKFETVDIKTRNLNFQVNHEKRVNEILKSLKSAGSLGDKQYEESKAVGSTPGVLYNLYKVHSAIVDVCPPFRPILSAIKALTFKTVNFLVPILNRLTIN